MGEPRLYIFNTGLVWSFEFNLASTLIFETFDHTKNVLFLNTCSAESGSIPLKTK